MLTAEQGAALHGQIANALQDLDAGAVEVAKVRLRRLQELVDDTVPDVDGAERYSYQSGQDSLDIVADPDNNDVLFTVVEGPEGAHPLPEQVARILISRDEIPNTIAALAKMLGKS